MEGITISSLGAVYVPSALQSVTITAHGQMQEQSFALCCPRDAMVCRALCQPQLTREVRGGSRGCLLGLSARTWSWAVPILPGDAEHHQRSHACRPVPLCQKSNYSVLWANQCTKEKDNENEGANITMM